MAIKILDQIKDEQEAQETRKLINDLLIGSAILAASILIAVILILY